MLLFLNKFHRKDLLMRKLVAIILGAVSLVASFGVAMLVPEIPQVVWFLGYITGLAMCVILTRKD